MVDLYETSLVSRSLKCGIMRYMTFVARTTYSLGKEDSKEKKYLLKSEFESDNS